MFPVPEMPWPKDQKIEIYRSNKKSKKKCIKKQTSILSYQLQGVKSMATVNQKVKSTLKKDKLKKASQAY